MTYSYVELLLLSDRFAECHRTLHFHDTHVALHINISEKCKHACQKNRRGVRLDIEARGKAKKEEENARLEAEE